MSYSIALPRTDAQFITLVSNKYKSPIAIHKFISMSALTWDHEKQLNPAFRETIAFKPGSGKNLKPSQNSNIKAISAVVY